MTSSSPTGSVRAGRCCPARICRDNGIVHRLTQPRSPTTTGKIERFHGSLRRELLDDAVLFADLPAAQAAVDAWVREYNTTGRIGRSRW